MRIKKRLLIGSIGFLLSISPIITALSINETKSFFTFDNLKFNDFQSLQTYVNKRYGILVNEKISENYYIEDDGRKIYLGNSQVQQLIDSNLENVENKQIYSTSADIKSNLINPSIGELSPQWVLNHEIEPNKSITIYRGDNDQTYLDEAEALNTFINSGYEIYYFNDIYFKDKADLYSYLINHYFDDANNVNNTSIRIKAPNGQYSNLITMNKKSDWKATAATFIQDNASSVIRIKTNNGYKYVTSYNDLSNVIGIDDIPYIKINANQGKQNYIVGLNNNDTYVLSGGNYYSGYVNIRSGMKNSIYWSQDISGFVPNYEDEILSKFNSAMSFLDSYISKGVKTNDVNGYETYSSTLLFSSNVNARNNNYKTINSVIDTTRKLPASFLGTEEDEFLSAGVYLNKQILRDGELSTYSKEYYDLFKSTNSEFNSYSYIYDEVISIADNYASMKNYNSLMKIPLLFTSMMDRLITVGAPTSLIQITKEYFKNVTLVYQNLLENILGDDALQPVAGFSSHGKMNLVKIFGIENENIEFDIQKYESYFCTVYSKMISAASAKIITDAYTISGLSLTSKTAKSIANDVCNELYSKKFDSTKKADVVNATYKSIVFRNNNYRSLMSNQNLWEEAATNWPLFTALLMIYNTNNDTTQRESILDSIQDYAGELLNSPDSWEYIPNDNVFKKYAFYVYETEGKLFTPNNILLTINSFNTGSLFAWSRAINYVNVMLQTESNSSLANKLYDLSSDYHVDEEQDDIYDLKVDQAIDRQNKAYEYMFEDKNVDFNNDSIFSSVYMTFNQYVAVTIMRMLADISKKDTLFIYDKEQEAVVINPEYATNATKIIIDVKENNPKLMLQLGHLYRGFQAIQQGIERDALNYRYDESKNFNLDDTTIRQIIKHQSQYASVINQNLDYLQKQLTSINVPLKTGQIIAYSGSVTWMYEERDKLIDFDVNIGIEKIPFSSNQIISDIRTFIPKVDKTKSAYVIPHVEVKNNNIEKITYISSVYLFPTFLIERNFSDLNKIEYTMEKFIDTSLLPQLGIDEDLTNWIFIKDVKFDDTSIDQYNFTQDYTYVKKWGNQEYSNIGVDETYGTFDQTIDNISQIDKIEVPYLPSFEGEEEAIISKKNEDVSVDENNDAFSTKTNLLSSNKQKRDLFDDPHWNRPFFDTGKSWLEVSEFIFKWSSFGNLFDYSGSFEFYKFNSINGSNTFLVIKDSLGIKEIVGAFYIEDDDFYVVDNATFTSTMMTMSQNNENIHHHKLIKDDLGRYLLVSKKHNINNGINSERVALAAISAQNDKLDFNNYEKYYGNEIFDVLVNKTYSDVTYVSARFDKNLNQFYSDNVYYKTKNSKEFEIHNKKKYDELVTEFQLKRSQGLSDLSKEFNNQFILDSNHVTMSNIAIDEAIEMKQNQIDVVDDFSDSSSSSDSESYYLSDIEEDVNDKSKSHIDNIESDFNKQAPSISAEQFNDKRIYSYQSMANIAESSSGKTLIDSNFDLEELKGFLSEQIKYDKLIETYSSINNFHLYDMMEDFIRKNPTPNQDDIIAVLKDYANKLPESIDRNQIVSCYMVLWLDDNVYDKLFNFEPGIDPKEWVMFLENATKILIDNELSEDHTNNLDSYLLHAINQITKTKIYDTNLKALNDALTKMDFKIDDNFYDKLANEGTVWANDLKSMLTNKTSITDPSFQQWIETRFGFKKSPLSYVDIDEFISSVPIISTYNSKYFDTFNFLVNRNYDILFLTQSIDFLYSDTGYVFRKILATQFINEVYSIMDTISDGKFPSKNEYRFLVYNLSLYSSFASLLISKDTATYKNILKNINERYWSTVAEKLWKNVNGEEGLLIYTELYQNGHLIGQTLDETVWDILRIQMYENYLKSSYTDLANDNNSKAANVFSGSATIAAQQLSNNGLDQDQDNNDNSENIGPDNDTDNDFDDDSDDGENNGSDIDDDNGNIDQGDNGSSDNDGTNPPDQGGNDNPDQDDNGNVDVDNRPGQGDNGSSDNDGTNPPDQGGNDNSGSSNNNGNNKPDSGNNGNTNGGSNSNQGNNGNSGSSNNNGNNKPGANDVVNIPSLDAIGKNKIANSHKTKLARLLSGAQRIMNLIDIAGTIMGIVDMALMIQKMVSASQPKPCSYSFKVDNYEWQWNGGTYKYSGGGLSTVVESIVTASSMKMNNPILVNHSYVRDGYYLDGKLYDDSSSGRAAMLSDYINSISSKSSSDNRVETLYTFNNEIDNYIQSSDNIDKYLGLYSDKEELSEDIINDIEMNGEHSRYTAIAIKNFSDSYGGNWGSLNSVAAIEAAANSIISKIRPTIISMRPIIDDFGLLSRRNFTGILPGNSYDSKTNSIITESQKAEKYLGFNTNSWFIINNSANLMNNDNFVEPSSLVAIKNAKSEIEYATANLYKEDLLKSTTYESYSSSLQNTKFSTVQEKILNGIRPHDVIVYSTNKYTKYFVDTIDSNNSRNVISTAYDNLIKFIKLQNGVKLEINVNEVISYYIYDGFYFSSLDNLLYYASNNK